MTQAEAIDRYFALCVRGILAGAPIPAWPDDLTGADVIALATQRLEYHGIALLIAQSDTKAPNWPSPLSKALSDQARLQAIWESDHAAAITRLIDRLHHADFQTIMMKGTALAYSVYQDPALRRRGDTDLLIESMSRENVRRIFLQCGFQSGRDKRALQETWVCHSRSGFTHQVDLHWDASSSMAIAAAIGRDHPRQRTMPLPRLSSQAVGTGPIDSFIQICINRTGHEAFGYHIEDGKVLDGDRLIWALDLHYLAADFTPQDWQNLARISKNWGAAKAVASALDFASQMLGTQCPPDGLGKLEEAANEDGIICIYYASSTSTVHRFKMDFAAAPTFSAKLKLITERVLPDRTFMGERYPESDHLPLAALHLRRMLDAAARMLLGRSR
ncbi:nucleotidyltransferase family protein [Erythrobacter insulae]|nr:nucleotidyltransferase family protein [Erythrobacter insulae]